MFNILFVFYRQGFCFVFLLITLSAMAQNPTNERDEKRSIKSAKKAERIEQIDRLIQAEEMGTIVYNKQAVFGGRLYNNGYGLYFEHAKMKSVTKSDWWTVELGERKHAKELTRFSLFSGNSLTYGKRNYLLFAKGGLGKQVLVGGKGNRNGVAVSALYGGGAALGIIKPYVYLLDTGSDIIETYYKGDNSTSDQLLAAGSADMIGAGFFKGFNNAKITPGLHAKTSLRFDYGRYNELVSAIQCGINAEYYFTEVPLMIANKPSHLFLNVFIGLEFGKRK